MTYRAWNLKTLDRAAVRELTHAIAEQNTEELEYHSQSEEPWTEAQYNATLAAQQKETALLAGILAATMSTADSQLLAAASSVSENILREAFHLKISEKKSMLAARLTVIGIAILGIIIARNPDSSVFGIVSFAWAGFGAAFGPLVICSLFWKRTTLPGAIAGMVSGGAMVFIWKYLIKPIGGVFGIYELLPAFLVGLVLMVIVSLCTKAPSKEITDEFDRVKAMGKAK